MNTQSGHAGRGLLNNFWAQMAVLAIVVIVALALAAKYIW
jgi:anti-sigma-K factor RskA